MSTSECPRIIRNKLKKTYERIDWDVFCWCDCGKQPPYNPEEPNSRPGEPPASSIHRLRCEGRQRPNVTIYVDRKDDEKQEHQVLGNDSAQDRSQSHRQQGK